MGGQTTEQHGAAASGPWRPRRRRVRWRRTGQDPEATWPPSWLVVAVVLAIVLGIVVSWAAPGGFVTDDADRRGAAGCATTDEVLVVAAPEVEDVARDAVSDVPEPSAGSCVRAQVIDREPADVLSDVRAGEPAPDVWLPDSSLWATRVGAAGGRTAQWGTLGEVPVVVVTSSAAARELGWDADPPAWDDVFASGQPLVSGLAPDAASVLGLAVAAQRQDPSDLVADLALGSVRSSAPTDLDALAGGDPDAPLLVTDARSARAVADDGGLAVVTPEEPARAVLDYPVLTSPAEPGAEPDDTRPPTTAVRAVTDALLSARVGGPVPMSADGRDGAGVPTVRTVGPELLSELDDAFAELAVPQQMIVVVDASTSMLAPAGDTGGTRAEVAASAVAATLGTIPDDHLTGLWYFADDLAPGQDYRVVAPLERMDAVTERGRHREYLGVALAGLPDELAPGGTALHDVVLAAMRAGRAAHDPRYPMSVVVLTDGRNEDSDGLTRDELVATLRAEAAQGPRVDLYLVAFGPDADPQELGDIAVAAGGWGRSQALDASDESSLRSLLADRLAERVRGGFLDTPD